MYPAQAAANYQPLRTSTISQNDAQRAELLREVTIASNALFSAQTPAELEGAKSLWQAIDSREANPEKYRGRTYMVAFEEFSCFIQQLRGLVDHPKAFSVETGQWEEAPKELYECLARLEDAYVAKNHDELARVKDTLITTYIPKYRPTVYCMIGRLFAVHELSIEEPARNQSDEIMRCLIMQTGLNCPDTAGDLSHTIFLAMLTPFYLSQVGTTAVR